MSNHTAYANGLRELADWIEAHPTIALPCNTLNVFGADKREEAAAILAALKPCKKDYSDEMFYIKRDFGPITLSFVFYRSKVCVAKVIGQKVTPEVREPAKTIEIPEKITPEHTEDIIEWDCSAPLLKTLCLNGGNMTKFGPKAKDHPSIGELCPACKKPFIAGDFTSLIVLGPGDDPEAKRRAKEGRPYNAVAVEVHYSCGGGE